MKDQVTEVKVIVFQLVRKDLKNPIWSTWNNFIDM